MKFDIFRFIFIAALDFSYFSMIATIHFGYYIFIIQIVLGGIHYISGPTNSLIDYVVRGKVILLLINLTSMLNYRILPLG